MESHIKAVGIINIVLGALGVVVALGLMAMFGGIGMIVSTNSGDPDARVALPILGLIGAIVFVAMLVISVPLIIAGVGILKFRPWARILGIIFAVLELLNVPVGTAAGIYSLWVLLNERTAQIFTDQVRRPFM